MNELQQKATEFKREELREVLMQCTSKQIELFNRMYGSIDEIPEEKMDWAYTQCINTLKKSNG